MKVSLTLFFLAAVISKALGGDEPYGGIDCAREGLIFDDPRADILVKAGCSCDFDILLTFGVAPDGKTPTLLVERPLDDGTGTTIPYFIPDADPTQDLKIINPDNNPKLKFTYEGQGWIGFFYTDKGLGQWKTPFFLHRDGCTLVVRNQNVVCYTDFSYETECDCTDSETCSYDAVIATSKIIKLKPEEDGECINVCQELSLVE